jgi:hypothetical protein
MLAQSANPALGENLARAVFNARQPILLWKGSGRSMIESTSEKIAVFAPIPSASVNTAVSVNPGDFRNCRNANFRSLSMVSFLVACCRPLSSDRK